jgi:hypothetical protein
LYYFTPDYSNLIVNKPIDYIVYNYFDGNLVNDQKVTYHYSTVTASYVSDVSPGGYSVFPNPVSDILNFSFTSTYLATFELYDTQGRKLMLKKIANNEQLSLEGLNSGIYLYYLDIGGVRQKGKLIKK